MRDKNQHKTHLKTNDFKHKMWTIIFPQSLILKNIIRKDNACMIISCLADRALPQLPALLFYST